MLGVQLLLHVIAIAIAIVVSAETVAADFEFGNGGGWSCGGRGVRPARLFEEEGWVEEIFDFCFAGD